MSILVGMKKLILSFVIIFSPLFAAGIEEQDEIETIQTLIDATKKNLQSQYKLFKLMVEFKLARAAFVEEPTNGKRATSLVKCAIRLQNHLEKEHLSHLFSPDLISEITFFNQVGKQQLANRE